MHVRLGTTLDGSIARLDTNTPSLTMLLADAGDGKTTLARYLTRWWLARTGTTVTVHARRPREWTDLSHLAHLQLLDLEGNPLFPTVDRADEKRTSPPPSRPSHLTVVDGIDSPGLARFPTLPRPEDLTIITATSDWFGSHAAQRVGPALVHRWGLLPRRAATEGPAGARSHGTFDPLQHRLDWGSETQPLLPCHLGPHDYPSHRWASDPHRPATLHTPEPAAFSLQPAGGDRPR
jgi:hypothetical protein